LREPSSSALAITLVLQVVVDGEIGDKVSLIPAATPPNNNGLQLYTMYVYVYVRCTRRERRRAQEADAAVPEEKVLIK
jgi:hypothetical protein